MPDPVQAAQPVSKDRKPNAPTNPLYVEGVGGSGGTVDQGEPNAGGDDAWPVTDQADEFWRIRNRRFADNEEVRYDIPAVLANANIYIGVAPDGTGTNEALWVIIRTYLDASGNPLRERIRFNVAWDSRTVGWT